CIGATRLGVLHQRNAVRAKPFPRLRARLQNGFDDIKLPEHRRGEDIHARAVLEEMKRNISPPHMRRCPKSGFPITVSPIPRGIALHGWSRGETPPVYKIPMALPDDFLAHSRVKTLFAGHAQLLDSGLIANANPSPASFIQPPSS